MTVLAPSAAASGSFPLESERRAESGEAPARSGAGGVLQSFDKRRLRGANVKVVHLDGKMPNLALMKLCSWLKARGATVWFTKHSDRELMDPEFDLVLASSIFNWSGPAREALLRNYPNAIIGGTGTGDWTNLEEWFGEDWDELDYSIYPWFKPSIGFTQRGCRLKCSFCVVPKKEGRMKPLKTIHDIWRGEGHPKQILLLDNDFFGQPEWRQRIEEIQQGGFEVSFNQGINVRLIHKEGAEALAKVKYRDDQFKTKRIYTAWDNRRDEEIFKRGIRILLDAGIHPTNITVYMLCGYWPGETMDDIFFRFHELRKFGVFPFPMVYDNSNRTLKRFQQWCLTAAYRYYDWEFFRDHSVPKGRVNREQGELFPAGRAAAAEGVSEYAFDGTAEEEMNDLHQATASDGRPLT